MVKKTSGMAIASLVLGICSLFLFWTFVVPVLAIVFGGIALSQIKKDKDLEGKSMSIWGIVLGAFWIILFILLVFVGVFWALTSNLMDSSSGNVYMTTNCLDVDLSVVDVVDVGNGFYDVTLESSSDIQGSKVGAYIVFFNEDSSSNPLDFGYEFGSSGIKSQVLNAEIMDAERMEVTPFISDEYGKDLICPTAMESFI